MRLFIEALGLSFSFDVKRSAKPAPAPSGPQKKSAEQLEADKAVTPTTTGGPIGFASPTRNVTPGHNRWEPGSWQDGIE